MNGGPPDFDRDGAEYLDRDVLDAPAEVEYRPVPGFPRYRVGSDWSVWFDRRPKTHCIVRWRRMRKVRIGGHDGFVRLRHGGREHARSVALLRRAAFAPDPSLWLDRIGPRPKRPGRDEVMSPSPPARETASASSRDEVTLSGVVCRPIRGCPGYRMGSDRSVWSSRDRGAARAEDLPHLWQPLKPYLFRGKYPAVILYIGGSMKSRLVNKLYRATFPEEAARDAAEARVTPADLPTGSPSLMVGSESGRALLDEEKVAELRRLKAEGWTMAELCERYGVGRVAIHYALVGKTWSHVPLK